MCPHFLTTDTSTKAHARRLLASIFFVTAWVLNGQATNAHAQEVDGQLASERSHDTNLNRVPRAQPPDPALNLVAFDTRFGLTLQAPRAGEYLPFGAASQNWIFSQDTRSTPSAAPPGVEPGETFGDCSDCGEMVVVPPGEFEMGSADSPYEKPVHHVTIAKPFAIGRHLVTFAEWDHCVTEGGCKYSPEDRGWGRGNRPVIDVSWEDAQSFISWLSTKTGKKYRLPTEAEWEYAARAGTSTAYWWGRDVGSGHANCDGCGGASTRQTVPAGTYRPNGFGLFDTAGNAAEWVEDCWNESYRTTPRDGSPAKGGDCRLRVLRGGSFGSKPDAVRSASRFRYDVDVRYYANGFRVVRDIL